MHPMLLHGLFYVLNIGCLLNQRPCPQVGRRLGTLAISTALTPV